MHGLHLIGKRRMPDSPVFISTSSRRQLTRRRARHLSGRTSTLSKPLPGVAARRWPVWFHLVLTVVLLGLALSLVSGRLIV